MMKRSLLSILLLLLFTLVVSAQTISVQSFRALPTDMTASSLDGKRIDQNGDVAALIRVVTPEQGFVFEGGTLGVVDTKQKVGEIWVWVPRGARKISIMHQQLGVLRDYRYPIEIEAERTYEMVLTTARIETIIKEEVRQQYLLFQLDPPNATLEVDDKLWSVEADGTAMKYVDFGIYKYRVRASDYSEEIGLVTVDDPDETKVVPVKLKSNFAEVTLKVDADAEIWVNNQKKGIRTWTGKLGNGTYKIECKQAGYETTMVSKEITRDMSGETITLPAPTPVYGSLMVESTPNLATIFLDGKEVGKTPKSLNEVLAGQHKIKLVKEGYEDHTETITLTKGERKQVKLTMNKQEGQPLLASNTNSGEDQTFTVYGVSFTMKLVEGGTFQMGAQKSSLGGQNYDSEAYDDESPVHNVTLSSYYMGETEVTQALWKAVMGDNPSYFKGDNLPVEQVSWNDIQDFIRKLNQKTGKNFRLPTEAEWEYAAREGKKNNGYKYSGSNVINSVAWYWDNGDKKTYIVKTKSPNELGLYDMTGNVWEWCSDWYESDYYGKSPSTNPQGPSSGSDRVLRGGSWYVNARNCRVSYRRFNDPDCRFHSNGFRLCLP